MSEQQRYADFIRDFSGCEIWCRCGAAMRLRDSYREMKPPERTYYFVCEPCSKVSEYKCEKVGN